MKDPLVRVEPAVHETRHFIDKIQQFLLDLADHEIEIKNSQITDVHVCIFFFFVACMRMHQYVEEVR